MKSLKAFIIFYKKRQTDGLKFEPFPGGLAGSVMTTMRPRGGDCPQYSVVSSVRHEAPHQPLSHPRTLPRTAQGKFIKSKLEENIRNILSHSICALNSKYIEMLQ